jgi:tRNA-2-methylthio-N6-dimethylallyladenosine synthase
MPDPQTFACITYGCQMNAYDSELVAELLAHQGYQQADLSEADVLIVNTCSVRDHAERRALGRLRALRTLKEQRPDTIIAVIGCMAQRRGKQLLERVPWIDLVVGPDGYRSLPQLIQAVQENGTNVVSTDLSGCETYSGIHPQPGGAFQAFVAVMRGCSNRCTYCIVPYVRGPARSRSLDDILEEVKARVRGGVKEVTLLGQNVNGYRDGEVGFAGLVERVASLPGIGRVRFTTSHPKDLTAELFDVMAGQEAVCEHLHLPMQSASSPVLKRMGRGYTREDYLDLVDEARERVPGLALTTDILVGFPGETEKQFGETLDAVREIRFHFAYMFGFSPRPGTPAAVMDQLPREVVQSRLSRLIQVQNSITRERNAEMVGHSFEVLVEGKSPRSPDQFRGRTRTNTMVAFSGGEVSVGDPVCVKIERLQGWTPVGRLATDTTDK